MWAEENGALIANNLDWSFGDRTERNSKYGWPSPVSGKTICGSISASAGNNQAFEIHVISIGNGNDMPNYEFVKPNNREKRKPRRLRLRERR